jgi:Protein of unknown function (DUF2569)
MERGNSRAAAMKVDNPAELRRIYTGWPVEKLVRATYVDASQYDPTAVEVMKAELEARGIAPEEIESLRSDMALGRDDDSRLSGVRGWLLLFIIMVGLASGGGIALSLLLIGIGDWLAVTQGMATLAIGVYGGYCAWMLANCRSEAPAHARRWLIALALNGIAIGAISLALHGELPSGVGRPLLFAMIWLPYLARSKRVANVYGPRTSRA